MPLAANRIATLVALSLVAAWSDASDPRPNVLLCVADDWSYGHAGAYGCDWVDTPAFDRVAREGLLFRRFYTPNAKCAPSRACLLTGRNSWQLGAAANHSAIFPPEYKGFVEALRDAGYRVGYTGKGWAPGWAETADGRPRELTGERFADRRLDPPTKGISENDYAGNFSDFLEAAGSAPWCFWYGSLEPHRGYEYGSGARLAGKTTDQIDRVPGYWPDNEVVRNDLLDYALEVQHFDEHVGRMLELLGARGELDRTLVVVTSDHGMPFPRGKGQAYEESNHVPLAVRWPDGIEAPGRTVGGFASMIDLAPTVLEAAGVDAEETGMAAITGQSLTDRFGSADGGEGPRGGVLIGKERHDVGRPHDEGYPIRGVVTARWLYLRNHEPDRWPAGNPEAGYPNCDASPTKTVVLDAFGQPGGSRFWELCFGKRPADELYDLKNDPDCIDNLATDAGYADVVQQLRSEMQRRLAEEGDPRMRGEGRLFDDYPYSSPATRGFYEKLTSGQAPEAPWIDAADYRPEQNPDFEPSPAYQRP
ncbi:sulfatase [Botrimarina sp.]|uniref:sulfatase family protein n=1 Tax=Botrimarina sp. TaxID=2795802 RepID=UPI0032EBED0C